MLSKSCSISFTKHLLKYENILNFIWFNKKEKKSMKNLSSGGGGGGGACLKPDDIFLKTF